MADSDPDTDYDVNERQRRIFGILNGQTSPVQPDWIGIEAIMTVVHHTNLDLGRYGVEKTLDELVEKGLVRAHGRKWKTADHVDRIKHPGER